jgi:hypothetical protein
VFTKSVSWLHVVIPFRRINGIAPKKTILINVATIACSNTYLYPKNSKKKNAPTKEATETNGIVLISYLRWYNKIRKKKVRKKRLVTPSDRRAKRSRKKPDANAKGKILQSLAVTVNTTKLISTNGIVVIVPSRIIMMIRKKRKRKNIQLIFNS